MANPTFTEAFIEVSGQVSAYMLTEYNAGRLTDANYATVQAQAINSVINAALTMHLETDIKSAQYSILAQQVLTEIQQTANAVKQGEILAQQKLTEIENTVLVTEQHQKIAYETTYILPAQKAIMDKQDDEVATKIMLMEQQIMTEEENTLKVSNEATLVSKESTLKEKDATIKQYQIDTLLPDEHNKNEQTIANLTQQGVNLANEGAYTQARTTVVKESRIDNLALETLKAQQAKLATIGAGGLTPSTNDFANETNLISALYGRARNTALPSITFSTPTSYAKAV